MFCETDCKTRDIDHSARQPLTLMLNYVTQHGVDLVEPPDANGIRVLYSVGYEERWWRAGGVLNQPQESVNLIYLHTCGLAAEGPELIETAGGRRCRAQSSSGGPSG